MVDRSWPESHNMVTESAGYPPEVHDHHESDYNLDCYSGTEVFCFYSAKIFPLLTCKWMLRLADFL